MARRGSRLTGAVLVAALSLTGVGVADVGADDPDPTATPTTVAPPDSTVPDGPGEPTTTVGEGTTTLPAPPVTSGPGGFGPPRPDPDAPPEPPMPDPSPQVRVLLDQLLGHQLTDLDDHHAHIARLHDADVARYEDREADARDEVRASRAALADQNREIERIQDELRADALARYMSPGASGIERLISSEDSSRRTRAILSEVTIDLRLEERRAAFAERNRIRARIEDDLAALERAEAATEDARGRAAAAAERAAEARAELEAERDLVLDPNRPAGSVQTTATGAASDWSLPIAGESVFTPAELTRWFVQRGVTSRAAAPIEDLARFYIEEGRDQGIRGDMAFAQAILETGSFTNRDTILLNNFAGIGHCDSCAQGFGFASPHLGVRAQIQLLADYTERDVELAHPLVDRRLRGPSGCCQTWWDLTHTWATAGNYGPKIMGIYREMLHWLVLERGMTPLVGPR